MRFQITMNMGSRSGNAVHQIVGEHPATSLDDFLAELSRKDYVVVEEFYSETDAQGRRAPYTSQGKIAINSMYVGKVKVHGHRGS